jgi:hypothetical protein
MTAHLRDTEFADLLDGALGADRQAHLKTCQACREKADELTATLAAVEDRVVPEPSPLFWDHFSARVRAAIDVEPAPGSAWHQLIATRSIRWTAIATAATLVIAIALWRSGLPSRIPPAADAPATASSTVREAPVDQPFGEIEADEAWALVRSMADELDADEIDAAGIGARPGLVERVASGLSDVERTELAELIQSEIKARRSVPSS